MLKVPILVCLLVVAPMGCDPTESPPLGADVERLYGTWMIQEMTLPGGVSIGGVDDGWIRFSNDGLMRLSLDGLRTTHRYRWTDGRLYVMNLVGREEVHSVRWSTVQHIKLMLPDGTVYGMVKQ